MPDQLLANLVDAFAGTFDAPLRTDFAASADASSAGAVGMEQPAIARAAATRVMILRILSSSI